MLLQPFPFWLHRCQRYANEIGLEPDQAPLAAVSVSPARGVPEMVGSDVFVGATLRAPCAEPTARSRITATAPTYRHIHRKCPLQTAPEANLQTKCLPGLEAGYFS